MKALLLLLLALPAAASDRVGIDEGTRHYEAGRYEEAVARYQEAVDREPLDPVARYDLGNAFYRRAKAGDLGRAIASWQRAFALSPRDSDIRHNLDFALKRAGESLVPAGMPAPAFILFHILSRDETSALHWLGFWLLLLLLSAGLWNPEWRARLRPWTLCAGLLWAAAGAGWALIAFTDVQNPGVILAADAEVRSGPGLSAPVSFKVPEGRRVSVLGESSGWVEIGVLREGLKGWIPADQLEKI
ncbi:MAG: tetratricopeptide repeat protein [Elusimicrobiota bacterium]|jgi:tetratricopeptide (TPR) repeat protein